MTNGKLHKLQMLLSKQILNVREKTKSFPQKLHRIGKYFIPKYFILKSQNSEKIIGI